MSKVINSLLVYSTIDITPDIGDELDGYHREGPSMGIKDQLTASSTFMKLPRTLVTSVVR